MRYHWLGTLALLALTASPQAAQAQRLQIHAAATAGTGLSLGTGAPGTAARRSATYVDLQVLGANSEQAWLRYGLTLRAELEGKVTIAIVPQVALLTNWQRLTFGVIGGIPIVLMPQSLYGLEAGGLASFRILDWLSATLTLCVSVFPLGSDLPTDSVLVMLQAHGGIQIHF